MSNTHEDYWRDYSSVQYAKHYLLGGYLQAWFPILASLSGRVLYVDCHAGRGRHAGGHVGSPLVAINTLLGHASRDRILSACEVCFYLFENDPGNHRLLVEAVRSTEVPANVVIEATCAGYEDTLTQELDELEARGEKLASSFFFLDPFSYDLSMPLMSRILRHPRTELLVTLMFRYIDMAMRNRGHEDRLDRLFGSDRWREIAVLEPQSARHDAVLKLFVKQLGCRYHSVLEMRGESRSRVYDLIHATNHGKGREAMKAVLWKLAPHGQFVVFQADHPDQLTLIQSEPDLGLLGQQLLAHFAGREGPVAYNELKNWALSTDWRETHAYQAAARLCKKGDLTHNGTGARLPNKEDLALTFPPRSI